MTPSKTLECRLPERRPTIISVFFYRRAIVVLGAAVLSVASASAADAPVYVKLLEQALSQAPVLAQQQANVGAAVADAQQSKALLNPRIDTLFENLGAPASGGQSQRQSTYSVTQPFEVFGKRAARIEAGERTLGLAQTRRRQAQVDFAAELAVAYASVEAAQALKNLAHEDLTRANDDLGAAQAQVRAGKEAQLRLAQAQASVSAAQARTQSSAADLTQALERLSALVGSDIAYSGVSGSLLDATGEGSVSSTEIPPAVATARAERDVFQAQVVVEQKKWVPEIGISAGLRRYAWSGQNGYVLGVSATIPLLDRNEGGISAAQQRVIAAESRLEEARLMAQANQRIALAQVQAANQRLTAASTGEAAANEAYRLGRIGYESGKTSLIELLVIRRALSEARGTTIEARLARVRALSAMAQAEGRLAFGEEIK
ncbi:TolC family protein [Comamonas thiooxydans]|uniref:TolC family protein n=1 Tax=Comamonas thiooxydans TaxID=363952 RepID=UPI000A2DFAE3|nr:TolC family protein [Comamonas thiooxydans]BDR09400.1 TolC family protein [Comamonas thiooxydans]